MSDSAASGMQDTMMAIMRHEYGSSDVLKLETVEKPIPKGDEVLVRVKAVSVNPADYYRMKGGLARLMGEGLRRPKDSRFGSDLSGVVQSVGDGVKEFKPGDEVFGARWGCYADFVNVREAKLVRKPSNISFEEAAAVPIAGITALQCLRKGGVRQGLRVLVNGASGGGVGTYLVQIAKSYGAEVTGVCSTRNLDMVSSIGADRVLDYTKVDFTRTGDKYDLICDTRCSRSSFSYRRALVDGGACLVVGFASLWRLPGNLLMNPLASLYGKRKVGFMGIAKITKEDLTILGDLLQAGKMRSVIDRTYPLERAPEAVHYLGELHARGKVVITV